MDKVKQINSQNDLVAEKNAKEYDAHAQSWQESMSTNAGHKYLEKPAMEKQLPATFDAKAVLCIGVGLGDELQEILKRNPARVVGMDISTELLNIAQSRFPAVEFRKMDMNSLDFPDSSFDFIYSSLTLHYAKDWDALCSEMYRVLKKEGGFLFSTHHPEYWSHETPTGATHTNQRGVVLTEHTALLPGGVNIIYYNHPNTDSICDALKYAGFKIEKSFIPPVVDLPLNLLPKKDLERYKKIKNKNAKTPLFFIIKALKI
jgi:ubiquinone/menaquinone biosynthesis C-methylase UbiE